MKSIVLAFVLLFPFVALAIDAVEVNARDHTCDKLAQIIRKDDDHFLLRDLDRPLNLLH